MLGGNLDDRVQPNEHVNSNARLVWMALDEYLERHREDRQLEFELFRRDQIPLFSHARGDYQACPPDTPIPTVTANGPQAEANATQIESQLLSYIKFVGRDVVNPTSGLSKLRAAMQDELGDQKRNLDKFELTKLPKSSPEDAHYFNYLKRKDLEEKVAKIQSVPPKPVIEYRELTEPERLRFEIAKATKVPAAYLSRVGDFEQKFDTPDQVPYTMALDMVRKDAGNHRVDQIQNAYSDQRSAEVRQVYDKPATSLSLLTNFIRS